MIERIYVCDCLGCDSQVTMDEDFNVPDGWRILHVFIPLTKREIDDTSEHPDAVPRDPTFDLAVCPKHGHVKLGFTVDGCELTED